MEIILLTLHINSLLISNPDSPSSDTTLHSQGYIKNGQLVCILHIFPNDNFCGTSIEATLLMYTHPIFKTLYDYTSFSKPQYCYTSDFQPTIYIRFLSHNIAIQTYELKKHYAGAVVCSSLADIRPTICHGTSTM